MTSDTTAISLSKMLMLGPAVSLKGSPTVSPTTARLMRIGALAAERASFDVFLCVVPGAAGVRHKDGE